MSTKITHTITRADPEIWLKARIDSYNAKIEKLRAELAKAEIELKGHQQWLDDVKRKGGRE